MHQSPHLGASSSLSFRLSFHLHIRFPFLVAVQRQFDSPIDEFVRQYTAVADFFNLEYLDNGRSRLSSDTPNALVIDTFT
jgi:hypothetical protein